MTGGVFTDGARDFLAGVPNACIEKPFDLAALRAMVAAAQRGAGALRWTAPQKLGSGRRLAVKIRR